ncbi:hypothetical protein JOQ06_012258 [Pogonophryne albipinna]|uniref:Uncharacterized protein n=1 Tax=Pogonophryne albipinna TaxID=1090488 RepID=A0AAD6BGF2_9TELE|nr:hypothetical protein JOQ06_012258 [Pogonophryne albipinna]
MVEKLESFTRKELFESDISTGRLLHFSTLKSQALGQVTELMVDFIKQLRANFTSRFEDYSIPKDIIAFTHERNRLTHKNLENCLRIKVTSISPDIQKIATDGRCQFSH